MYDGVPCIAWVSSWTHITQSTYSLFWLSCKPLSSLAHLLSFSCNRNVLPLKFQQQCFEKVAPK